MDKQSRVRIPRHLVYSPAQIAARVGISAPDARNRMAAGLIPGSFKSGEGMMSRHWAFRPMVDAWLEAQQRQPDELEALADRMIAALRDELRSLRVNVTFGEVER